MSENKFNWTGPAAFIIVLLCMPLGHAAMILMEHWFHGPTLHLAAFVTGAVGVGLTIWGTRLDRDSNATLCGFFGGLLVWTGWIEFLYVYFAGKLGVAPLVANGEVTTKPEYLVLMSSVGFLAIVTVMYVFKLRSGCPFYCHLQRWVGIGSEPQNVALKGNKSMTTFMETTIA